MYKVRLVAMMGTLAICIIFATLFLYPQINTFLSLKNNIELMNDLLYRKEELLALYTENLAIAEVLEKEYEDKERHLPKLESHIKSIVFMNGLMSENRLTETEFTIGEMRQAEGIDEIIKTSVRLRGTGKYEDILNFLESIGNAGEFYVIDEATISFSGAADSETAITLVISIYADMEGY